MAETVLTVVDAFELSGGRRRLRLVSEVDGFTWAPGQRLALELAGGASVDLPPHRVRDFDPVEERLEIDFILHGDSPGTRWVRAAALGDRLIAEDADQTHWGWPLILSGLKTLVETGEVLAAA
jgi:NADPH-dependent ferric siderophore reductase